MEASSGVNYINEKEEDCDELSSAVDQMPPGFRFHPTDAEIIDYYLLKKVMDRWFQSVAVGEINLNKCEPWDLPEKAKAKMGEKEWFFFFEKETKYPSGMRSNRATASGYWKATGKDKEIYNGGAKRRIVGMKKTLVFYRGRAPKGEKMNWVIHEYRLQGDYSAYNLSAHAKEKWVVCKVFHKKNQTNPAAHVDGSSLLDTTPAPHQLIQASTLMLNNNYMFPHHPIIQYSAHTPSSLVYQHHHTIDGADTMESINGTQSKRPCDEVELEALGISPNISDLDSLWTYY